MLGLRNPARKSRMNAPSGPPKIPYSCWIDTSRMSLSLTNLAARSVVALDLSTDPEPDPLGVLGIEVGGGHRQDRRADSLVRRRSRRHSGPG